MTKKQLIISAGVVVALSGLSFVLVVFGGLVDVAGTAKHSRLVHGILRTTMESSIRIHARDVQTPAGISLRDRALAEKAFGHYSVACMPCHGAPGVKAAPWMVINPEAPPLVETAPRWSDAELYWIIKNGIRMTGMPALGPTHKESDLWAVSAFVRQLPTMTPDDYQDMAKRYQAAKQVPVHHHEGM